MYSYLYLGYVRHPTLEDVTVSIVILCSFFGSASEVKSNREVYIAMKYERSFTVLLSFTMIMAMCSLSVTANSNVTTNAPIDIKNLSAGWGSKYGYATFAPIPLTNAANGDYNAIKQFNHNGTINQVDLNPGNFTSANTASSKAADNLLKSSSYILFDHL